MVKSLSIAMMVSAELRLMSRPSVRVLRRKMKSSVFMLLNRPISCCGSLSLTVNMHKLVVKVHQEVLKDVEEVNRLT